MPIQSLKTKHQQAVALAPSDIAAEEAAHDRGVARSDKGDFGGAIKDYAEAIRLKPDDAVPYNNRGNARRKKGDLDGAGGCAGDKLGFCI
jgi:Flp pilus assembly protein TadD